MDLELKSDMTWLILIGSLLAAVLNIDFWVCWAKDGAERLAMRLLQDKKERQLG